MYTEFKFETFMKGMNLLKKGMNYVRILKNKLKISTRHGIMR
jgi:hypothetical protein